MFNQAAQIPQTPQMPHRSSGKGFLGNLFGGGLFSAVGNLFGNLFGNRQRRRSEREAREWNVRFWNMQNEYNHPSAQMERLRQAGLNPNLIYGTPSGSAVGNAGNIAPAKGHDVKFDNPLSSLLMYADARMRHVQTDNLRTQNTVMLQDAALKAAQTSGELIRNSKSKVEYEVARDLQKTSVDYQKEALRRLELQSIGQELDNRFKDQTLKDKAIEIMYRARIAREALTGSRLDNELKRLDRDLKKIGIEKGDPWYFRIMSRNPSQSVQFLEGSKHHLKEAPKKLFAYPSVLFPQSRKKQ